MTKSLMISIRPQYAGNILRGKKTLELRTWIPKDYIGWVYVYIPKGVSGIKTLLNRKVVARFWFEGWHIFDPGYSYATGIKQLYYDVASNFREMLQLEDDEIESYGKGKTLYAWHIKKLEIFDEPKELSEFYKYDKKWSKHFKNWLRIGSHDELNKFRITKPPQRSVWIYE